MNLKPLSVWADNTRQNSLPANENSLRVEVLIAPVISKTVTAQPASPTEGDLYIIPTGRTGVAWATFAINSLAIFKGGSWIEFVPFSGLTKYVAGTLEVFTTTWDQITIASTVSWGDISGTLSSQADLVAALDNVSIVTQASAFTIVPATHSGRRKWILAGGDITFNSAEALAAGQVYAITATATIDLIGTGVTLTAPAGGTLELESGMSVEVRMTSATAGRVIGQTVAIP